MIRAVARTKGSQRQEQRHRLLHILTRSGYSDERS